MYKRNKTKGKSKRDDNGEKKEVKIDVLRYTTLCCLERTHRLMMKILKKKREEKEKEKLKLKISTYVPKNSAVTYKSKFERNPFKENLKYFNKMDLIKHKMAIDSANRNIEKNRLKHVLDKVALHNMKAKSKLHISKEDEFEDFKNNMNKKINLIQNNTLKKSKKDVFSPLSKTEKEENNDNQHLFNRENMINYDPTSNNGENNFKNHYNLPPQHDFYKKDSFSVIVSEDSNATSKRPQTAQTNRLLCLSKNLYPQNKIKNYVINKPLYTTNGNKLLNDYNKMKTRLFSAKTRLKTSPIIFTTEEIDDFSKNRFEMNFFNLLRKYENVNLGTRKKPEIRNKFTFKRKFYKQLEIINNEYS